MKYKFFIVAAIFLATTAFIFANGQQEHSTVSGTVVSISDVSNGNVTVTVTANGKTYTATVPQTALNGLNVAVGKVVSVKGVEVNGANGTIKLEADSIEADGVSHDVASAKDGTDSKESPDKKDAETPDGGGKSSSVDN